MQGKRMLEILRSLEERELKRLGDFVYSRCYNKDLATQKLFDCLDAYGPSFELTEKDWSQIADQVTKGNTKSLSAKISNIQKLIDQLFLQQELEARPEFRNDLLMNAYMKREQFAYFKFLQKQSKLLYENAKKDIDAYYAKYLMEEKQYLYLFYEESKKSRPQLQKIIQSLDAFYFAKKLNLSCELLGLKDIVQIEFDDALFKTIEEVLLKKEGVFNSHILIYWAIWNLYQNPDKEEEFEKLITMLHGGEGKDIKTSDLNDIYTHAVNFCMKKIYQGETGYKHKLFELYELLVKNHMIVQDNGKYVKLGTMKNIVSLACHFGKMDWARDFVVSWKNRIEEHQKVPAHNFFLASISFYEQEHKEVLDRLIDPGIDSLGLFFYMDKELLRLRCFYELKKKNAFDDLNKRLKDSFRRNSKLSDKWKIKLANFLSIIKTLFQIKTGFKTSPVTPVIERIKNENLLTLKDWLLEKANEL